MKKKILLPIFLLALGTGAHAQIIFEETFDYTAGDAVVADALASTDNYDETTGWYTQNNSDAGTTTFTVSETALEYPGYALSGVGKGISYSGLDGQDLFKPFDVNVTADSTIYIAYMINFPSAQQAASISGSDFTTAAKMETGPSSANFACRVYTAFYSDFLGEEVSYGINKMSNGTTTWVSGQSGPWYAAGTTQLIVIKYYVGNIYGTTADEEADQYDDEMYFYVNPTMASEADNTPTLTHIDNTQKDAYRLSSSGSLFGGLSAFMVRSNAVGGTPAFQISGIRVAMTWETLFEGSSDEGGDGIQSTTTSEIAVAVSNGVLKVSESYDSYELYSVSGSTVAAGAYASTIDVASMQKGVYLLKLTQGTQQTVTKVVL